MHYSSWWKLRVAFAWIIRYQQYLKVKAQMRNKDNSVEAVCSAESSKEIMTKTGELTVEELREAEVEIIRRVQRSSFPDVLKILSKTGPDAVEKSNKKAIKRVGASIFKLNPQIKEGLLRAGGRLGNAPIEERKKHPIILPYKGHLTDLIIAHHHVTVGHMGQESVLSSLRSKFWVVKGRSAVRRAVRKCIDCQRRKARPCEQFMGNLPQKRLQPD
jgi:hypothetical protein